MARSQSELQALLGGLAGVTKAYFQEPGNEKMLYPCIVYKRFDSKNFFADNVKYLLKKRYQVTVITRDPDDGIPDLVEALPYSSFDRFFVANQLNHFVFNLYF